MVTAGRMRNWGCVLGVATLLAGCGSVSLLPGHHVRHAGTASTATVGNDGHPAAPEADVKVIEGWSSALRSGHISAAAGYFALPSVFDNGGGDILEIHSLHDAEEINESLPCGAQFISAFRVDGDFVDALFKLTTRTGPGVDNCNGAAGQPSRVVFLIKNGKISHWLRAADLPTDAQAVQGAGGGSSTTSTTSTGSATTPTGPSTTPTGPGTTPAPGNTGPGTATQSTGTSTNPAI